MNVIEASALGKRYGSTWALRECTLAIPGGHVAALVGPNGAGKTTLLNLAVGLTDPTAGTVAVLGGRRAGSPAALDGIAFVAQDAPLYKNLSVADMLHLTRNLNRHFDQGYAEAYNNMGALYYRIQRYGPAVREYRRALKISEANASFHSNLGTAYFSQKNYSAATREYARAMELDPTIFEHQTSGGVAIRMISSNDMGHFHYVMAQMYGQRSDQPRCRYYLSKANEEGYSVRDALHDDQFAGLRKDPDFVAFVRSLKAPPPANE